MADRPVELDIGELDLRDWVRPGDRILWGQAAAEPLCLTEALVAQRARLGGVTVFLTLSLTDTLRPEHADYIRFQGLGGLGSNRRLTKAGLLDPYPAHLSNFVDALASGKFRIDVALVQLAGPDADGNFSAGIDHCFTTELIQAARLTIAEVNAAAPVTTGAAPIRPGQLDVVVRSSRPLPELAWDPPTDADLRIADHVVELVPDGATVQVGIGAVPSAIVRGLHSRCDLGIHTGMISDPVMDLMCSGAVSNERKPVDTGMSTACVLLGSQQLYRQAAGAALTLRSGRHTHALEVLAQLPAFTAINSAVQIDLSGQVNAEFVAGSYVGAVAGQVDFVRGARMSRGGRSITVLRSRTRRGLPRIVSALADGIVTTARSDIDTVVTEWGVAELAHLTVSERARALIAIAHPEDRAELTREHS